MKEQEAKEELDKLPVNDTDKKMQELIMSQSNAPTETTEIEIESEKESDQRDQNNEGDQNSQGDDNQDNQQDSNQTQGMQQSLHPEAKHIQIKDMPTRSSPIVSRINDESNDDHELGTE